MCRSFAIRSIIGMALATLSFLSLGAEQEMLPFPSKGKVPPGYATDYATTITLAEDEGALVIYSTTDVRIAKYLIDDFRTLYPKLEVDYHDLNSTELHHRFIAESQLGSDSADIVWSSAMDQQFHLLQLGYAQQYSSPEISRIPTWAVWKEQGYGTTYEPVVIAYNKRLLAATQAPQTRGELIRLLNGNPAKFKGRVETYNIEKSGVGYLLAAEDAAESNAFWDLAKALGTAGTKFRLTSDAMLKSVASGRAIIAYNVLGSYAIAEARKNPSLGYVFPKDYTLVTSRIMFINKKAKNPNAAKLWVDYVLSRRGQAVIANQALLYSVRSDVEGEATASKLGQLLGDSVKPIPVGPELVSHFDTRKYRGFIAQWRQATMKK